ncbi:MAG: GGDEF domain-containing protein [Bacillota bacterium]
MYDLIELKKIIDKKKIKTVFQPIVDLKNGEIFGYEALSRGPENSFLKRPDKLFAAARDHNLLFKLEKICRKTALQNARSLNGNHKLFVNIDPHVVYDEDFKKGVTKDFLKKYNFEKNNIVIELTEKQAIENYEGFQLALNHYQKQGFNVAIDDTGAGYSGLQSIVTINYNYIKIDRSLITEIDKDPVKKAMIEAFIKFARKIKAKVIAEGVERKEELDTLIKLGVDYGQGYYLKRPDEKLITEIDKKNYIIEKNKKNISNYDSYIIEEIAIKDMTIDLDMKTSKVVKIFENNKDLQSIVVTDNNKVEGLIMRDKLYFKLGSKYGYSVYMDRPIKLVMDKEPLIVKAKTPISEVSALAMNREISKIYDCIIVRKEDNYYGTVSIKDLLLRFSQLQIEEAKQMNPLTNLPGNPVIEREINYRLAREENFSVLYIDLDNFKAYNDNYGYKKGDDFLVFTAEVLSHVMDIFAKESDFLGHVGGDDFVIVTGVDRDELISKKIITEFENEKAQFFNKEDLKTNTMEIVNREKQKCIRPLTSISIAIVSNENRDIINHLEISDIAAEIKKYVKNKRGSVYFKDRREN